MRRLWAALMITALFLGGCSDEERLQSRLDERRQEIADSEYVGFRADVCVELTDSVFDCVLQVERSDGEIVVEAIEPEIIAGIRARVSDGETAIEYEDLILVIGDTVLGEVSPVAAMLPVLEAMQSSYADMVWAETQGQTGLLAAQCYVSEDEYIRIWFASENMTPVNAELVSGGRVVVKCRIEDFTLENEDYEHGDQPHLGADKA